MKALLLLLLSLATLQAKDTWPPKPYTHVVAYCYDFTKDPRGSSIVFKDGTHSAGIIAPFTLRLDAKLTNQVVTLLNTPHKEELGELDCHDPHHAFVFYDETWTPIAWINICFMCENHVASPRLTTAPIDIDSLQKFVAKLGMPIPEQEADYQKLFNKHHATDPKPPAAPPKKDSIDPFATPAE